MTIIGYSGFDLFEECYEYYENECYIADTPSAAEQVMENGMLCTGEYRIDPIEIEQIMNDYGCSCGNFAMEEAAFKRFEAVAKEKGINFDSSKEDSLMIVEVQGVNISDQ